LNEWFSLGKNQPGKKELKKLNIEQRNKAEEGEIFKKGKRFPRQKREKRWRKGIFLGGEKKQSWEKDGGENNTQGEAIQGGESLQNN